MTGVPVWLLDAENGSVFSVTVAVFIFMVQWTLSSPWWKDHVGVTLVVKDLCLLVIFVPTCMMLAWPGVISPLTGAILGFSSLVGITVAMAWRSIVWYRIRRPWPLRQRADKDSQES